MNIAIMQSDLAWENPQANREIFKKKIDSINEIDLIILPEMFTTGFTMNPSSVAETMNGATVNWMISIAKSKNVALTGSVIIEEDGKYYNRMFFVFPNGKIQYYNKRHLFSLAKEEAFFTAGNEKVIVDYKDWKICLQICYDLRFPVFSRNVENYDVLIYVASWPKVRINAWDILLRARAVENLSYVIGVNRVGIDGNQLEYNGHSQSMDYLGNYIVEPYEKNEITIFTIDKIRLEQTRQKLNFLNDKDDFVITKIK